MLFLFNMTDIKYKQKLHSQYHKIGPIMLKKLNLKIKHILIINSRLIASLEIN